VHLGAAEAAYAAPELYDRATMAGKY